MTPKYLTVETSWMFTPSIFKLIGILTLTASSFPDPLNFGSPSNVEPCPKNKRHFSSDSKSRQLKWKLLSKRVIITSVNLKKAGMASRNIVIKKQYTLF